MDSTDSCTKPLAQRLEDLINEIERSAKMAKMVSMNASVIAVRSRTDSREAFAFEAVAEQIMEISQSSLSRIEGLRSILDEIDSLTSIINLAGRQRMLSQRYMKLALSLRLSTEEKPEAEKDMNAIGQLFESSLAKLHAYPLNSSEIKTQLNRVDDRWSAFKRSLSMGQLDEATALNETVLKEMQRAVQLYEALVHQH